jgi:flagellar basal-body rod modification protein FlgD
MSAVDSLSSSSAVADRPAISTEKKNAYSDLGTEQFLKIIMTELSAQDPLQPSDSKALLEQLSSLKNIQSSQDLSSQLKSLVNQNELASAANLIGKNVSGASASGTRISGRVTTINKTADGTVLTLEGGSQLAMSRLDRVLATPAASSTPAPTTPTPTAPAATPPPAGQTTVPLIPPTRQTPGRERQS